jgi:hypothetical protein
VQKGGGGESRQSQDPVSKRSGVLFCLKCGETGKPRPAVGFDEDGEVACDMHSVKAEIPAKPETVDEEKPDMPNEPKLCACGCGSELPEGHKWPRLRGHAGRENRSAPASKASSHANGNGATLKLAAPREAVITLQLPAAKVEKLLALLLQ